MAHTFDTKAQITGSGSPLAANYTCGAGATLLVLGIVVGGSTERAGGAPTYNGVALTKAFANQVATETNCEMWYMLAPPTESALSISIPNTGSLSLYCCASSYLAQAGYTSVLDFAGGKVVTGTNPSLTILPSVAGDVIVAVCGDGATDPPTARTHTKLYETDIGAFSDNHQYALVADTAETTIGWTATSDDYGIIATAFAEVDGWCLATVPAIKDTYLRSDAATTNYSTLTAMIVEKTTTSRKNSILSFDFASLVPAGSTITAAYLRLYAGAGTADRTVTAYRLLRTDWVETEATWNIYKGDTTEVGDHTHWGTAGALNSSTDYIATDSATQTTATNTWLLWTVTNQVQTALDDVSGVAHFLLTDEGANNASSAMNPKTKEYVTVLYRQPILEIRYTEPAPASAIKTVNGLVVASVKTKNGLAIASVATWNGLA